jgi:GNAT superfamily N-acetyltransferase
MLKFDSLASVPLEDLTTTLNEAFSDYFVPLQMTVDQLEAKLKVEDVDLGRSMGAFEREKPVGLLLHGVRQIDGMTNYYNAATGVIPSRRGRGVTGKMYAYFRQHLVTEARYKLSLEVITTNTAGIRAYEKEGLAIARTLKCYHQNMAVHASDTAIEVREIDAPDWLQFASFWDVQPTWQNAISSVENTRDASILGAYLENELVGYAILDGSRNTVMQLAVDKRRRRMGAGSALLRALQQKAKDELQLFNVDDKAVALDFLASNDFFEFISQYEMEAVEETTRQTK